MAKLKVSKRDKPREVDFQGIKVKVLTRNQFARYLGITPRNLLSWIERGIIYAPTFADYTNTVNNWDGEEVSRKYYILQEAVAIRTIMKDYTFGQRRPIQEDFIVRVHNAMCNIRDKLSKGDISLMVYPLILEFKSIEDFKSWFKPEILDKISQADFMDICAKIYLKGDKLLTGE